MSFKTYYMEEFYSDTAIDDSEDEHVLFHRHVIGEDHELLHIDALLGKVFNKLDEEDL